MRHCLQSTTQVRKRKSRLHKLVRPCCSVVARPCCYTVWGPGRRPSESNAFDMATKLALHPMSRLSCALIFSTEVIVFLSLQSLHVMNFNNLLAQESKEVWSLGRIVSRVMSEMQFGGLCRGSWQWWCLLLMCMIAIPASATLEEGAYATVVQSVYAIVNIR